jgi:hypothetical protein
MSIADENLLLPRWYREKISRAATVMNISATHSNF